MSKTKKEMPEKKKKEMKKDGQNFSHGNCVKLKKKKEKKDKANVPIAHSRWIRSVAGVAAD